MALINKLNYILQILIVHEINLFEGICGIYLMVKGVPGYKILLNPCYK